MPKATIVAAFDLFNQTVSHFEIGSCNTSEKELALKIISNLEKHSLIVFDRYYGARVFSSTCFKHDQYFFFRMKGKFVALNEVKVFLKTNKRSQVVELRPENKGEKPITVRLIRGAKDENGDRAVFATNLMDKKLYSRNDLLKLYFDRWGIETLFNRLKHPLIFKNFT